MGKYDDPNDDCRDPETGLYLAFVGDVSTNCPRCGQANTLHVGRPTNNFEFECAACGLEYVAHFTATPMPEQSTSRN
jgi:hypothetical protein